MQFEILIAVAVSLLSGIASLTKLIKSWISSKAELNTVKIKITKNNGEIIELMSKQQDLDSLKKTLDALMSETQKNEKKEVISEN
ncbi:hypothetical protein ACFGVR_06195 [Mucilaginibacter sp. AW1-3]